MCSINCLTQWTFYKQSQKSLKLQIHHSLTFKSLLKHQPNIIFLQVTITIFCVDSVHRFLKGGHFWISCVFFQRTCSNFRLRTFSAILSYQVGLFKKCSWGFSGMLSPPGLSCVIQFQLNLSCQIEKLRSYQMWLKETFGVLSWLCIFCSNWKILMSWCW